MDIIGLKQVRVHVMFDDSYSDDDDSYDSDIKYHNFASVLFIFLNF